MVASGLRIGDDFHNNRHNNRVHNNRGQTPIINFPIHASAQVALLSFVLAVSVEISAATIVDTPVIAIEPGLEVDDRIGGELGWVDNHTLLVTARVNAKSAFWERKVVRVDVRTGETKELINPGALLCTNPTEKVAGIMVGSAESVYAGNSKGPKPELKLYSWSSLLGKLTPKIFGGDWNSYICKKTKPADVNVPGSLAFYKEKDIRYLEAKDGYLRFPRGTRDELQNVVLIKDDKPVKSLQANPIEISPEPQYLPFRDEYLLSAGRFVMRGTMTRPSEAPATEYPLVTMTKSGNIRREYFRQLFVRSGLTVDGQSFPYAQGTMIFVSSRPKDGGGVYLVQGESVERIWCTNQGNAYDRQCRATSVSMSPDGCHFAFFAKGSDNLKSQSSYHPTLKILPLCE